MRKEFDGIEAAAQRIHHAAMTPEVREGLRDNANAHTEFMPSALVCLFRADSRRLEDRAKSLLYHLRGDKKIAASLRVHRNVGRASHRVETTRRAYQRADAGFVLFKKCLVAPVGASAPACAGLRGVNVNQSSSDTTDRLISEAWQHQSQHVFIIDSRRVRKKNYLAARSFNSSVLRSGLAESLNLAMKKNAALRVAANNLIRAVG